MSRYADDWQGVLVPLPRDLWRRVKTQAAQEGRSAYQVAGEALEDYLEAKAAWGPATPTAEEARNGA